jgi:hypothetical protein
MPASKKKKSRKSRKRTSVDPSKEVAPSGCKCGTAVIASVLLISYLILFLGTAYTHHMSPSQLFKVAWKQRIRFTNNDVTAVATDAPTEDALLRMRGSMLEQGSSVDDVAVALPLETLDDVRGIWTRVLDEKTNNFYYYNRGDNTVTWKTPPIWLSDMKSVSSASSSSSADNVNLRDVAAVASQGNNNSASLAAISSISNDDFKHIERLPLPPPLSPPLPPPLSSPLSSPLSPLPPLPPLPPPPPPLLSSSSGFNVGSAIVDKNKCQNDLGLQTLKAAAAQQFATKISTTNSMALSSPLWLRVVMVSHGRHAGGPNEESRPKEDMLRAVRTLMMDAATSGGSPFGNALGVVVANFAGPHNNPGYESAKSEALRDEDSGTAGTKFDFFDGGFDLLGSCGSSARRDFFAALEIGLSVGSCQNMLLLEAGESLCPSALLMLYYAVQKANDYDPSWSTLRVGKGKHGYGGLVIRCDAAAKLVQKPATLGGESSAGSAAANSDGTDDDDDDDDDDVDTFMNDLSSWMRKERVRTILPLLPNRPLGGAFSYRYRLISENLIGEGCGSSVALSDKHNDLSFHGDAKCVENDVSPCAAAENDAWLEYRPPNIPAVIGSHVMLVIGQPGQSCTDACSKLNPTTKDNINSIEKYECLSANRVKHNLNDCATLRGRFPCPGGCISLNTGTGSWPVPSQLVSNAHINGVSVYKGTCIIRQNGAMSLCHAASA